MTEPIVSLLTREVKHACAEAALSYSTMETMGERIRQLRLAKQWTQQELGDRVGVSRAAVAQWESGETKNIKNVTFRRLVRELGTTEDYLVFGPDEPGRRDSAGRFGKPERA